jgi:hypothetical protein
MHVYEEILMEVFRDFSVMSSAPELGGQATFPGGYDQRLAPDSAFQNRESSAG